MSTSVMQWYSTSASARKVAAVSCAIRVIVSGSALCTSRLKLRMVPSSTASPETMFQRVPEWKLPTVTTSGSTGENSRLTIVCRFITSALPATTASTPVFGIAPWQALPLMVILN